jgi:hypothetical protein
LPPAERRLALEAAATLAVVRIVLAIMPFRAAMACLGLRARQGDGDEAEAMPVGDHTGKAAQDAVQRALRRAVQVVPFRAVCLQQAVAASLMLRRLDLPVEVHFGVAIQSGGRLTAHAWSVSRGRILTGESGVGENVRIAVFTPSRKGACRRSALL